MLYCNSPIYNAVEVRESPNITTTAMAVQMQRVNADTGFDSDMDNVFKDTVQEARKILFRYSCRTKILGAVLASYEQFDD